MSKKSRFNNTLVNKVSVFLQNHLKKKNIDFLTANKCAELLDKSNILPNKRSKSGYNFRDMLRDGQDGLIDLVEGAYQKQRYARWYIFKKR